MVHFLSLVFLINDVLSYVSCSVVQLSPGIAQNHRWRCRDDEILCRADLRKFLVHVVISIEMVRSYAGKCCARLPLCTLLPVICLKGTDVYIR